MKKIISVIMILIMICGVISNTSQEVGAKDNYLGTRYKKMIKKINILMDTSKLPTSELNTNSAKAVSMINKEVKKVYKKELAKLKGNKAKFLKKSQKVWKRKRSKYYSKKFREWGPGTGAIHYADDSFIKYTKKRIKWLVKKYGEPGLK